MSTGAELANLIWFSLVGMDATILCNSTGYFAFTNVLHIEISGLQFTSCGNNKMLGGVISVRNAINLTLFNIVLSKLTSHGLYVHSVQLLKGEGIVVQNVESNASNIMNINYTNGTLSNIIATNNTGSSIVIIENSNLHIGGSINLTKNIAMTHSSLTIKQSKVEFYGQVHLIDNVCLKQGGALTVTFSSLVAFKNHLSIQGSRAVGYGGGIHVYRSALILCGQTELLYNTGGAFGGAINSHLSMITFNGTLVNISHNRVYGPTGLGGAIKLNDGHVHIIFGILHVENNTAIRSIFIFGGGVHIENSTLRSSEHASVTFKNNRATIGGAIYLEGALSLGNILVDFQGVTNFISHNFAIYGQGSFDITFQGNTTFYDNSLIIQYFLCDNACSTFNGTTVIKNGHSASISIDVQCRMVVSFIGMTTFINNSVHNVSIYLSLGIMNFQGINCFMNHKGGIISSKGGTFLFEGLTNFINIEATFDLPIIHTLESNVQICGDTYFKNNHVINRIGLIVFTLSTVSINGTITFTDNYAASTGGGISTVISTIKLFALSIFANNIAHAVGGGAFYAHESSIHFYNQSVFINNSCSNTGGAMLAINSKVHFFSIHNFSNNSALQGGAISLQYNSQLFLHKTTLMTFLKNTAQSGAALYVHDILNSIDCTNTKLLPITTVNNSYRAPCFFEADRGAMIIVNENFDKNGDSILYGGKLSKCNNRFAKRDFLNLFNLSNDVLYEAITSEAYLMCFCEHNDTVCDKTEAAFEVARGEQFNLSVIAFDQLDKPIDAIMRAEILASTHSNARLGHFESRQNIKDSCTSVFFHIFSDSDEDSVQVSIFAEGACNRLGTAGRTVNVVILPCPEGFQKHGDSCTCEERLQKYTVQCNVDLLTIGKASNFWVGAFYDNNTYIGLILYAHCPFDYCKTNEVFLTLAHPDVQCNFNRSGILCGKCLKTYSLTFGNSQCSVCSNHYIALILVFMAAGVVLVCLMLLLQLTVANGTLNGLIFYANIIAVNKDIFFPPGKSNWLKVFIAWINLDFGIQVCFFDGMDMYIHTWLQFFFPVYVWTLVGIIIIISRYSIWITRMLRSNPVAVLATLFLLSYAKLLRTIITIFYYAEVEYPNGLIRKVWFYDGNVLYLQGKHIPLFIFALGFFLLIFVPYNFVLMFNPYLQGLSRRLKQSNIVLPFHNRLAGWYEDYRIQAFMDAYNAPYNLEYRFWTGLFLLIRCILFLTFAFNSSGNPSTNLLIITTSTLGIVILTRLLKGRVYKNWFTDTLEATFLLNLGVYSAATYHNRLTGGNQEVLANIAVGLVFACFMIIGIYHIFQQLQLFNTVWPKLISAITRNNNRGKDQLSEQLISTHNELMLVPTEVNTTIISVSKT